MSKKELIPEIIIITYHLDYAKRYKKLETILAIFLTQFCDLIALDETISSFLSTFKSGEY